MEDLKFQKIAKILRIDQRRFKSLIEILNSIAKRDLIEEIYEEKEKVIRDIFLKIFNWYPKSVASEVFNVLFQKIRLDNFFFEQFFSRPKLSSKNDLDNILSFLKTRINYEGFFLKWEKGIEFLRKYPPKNLVSFLGARDVDELIEKEKIEYLLSALRFSEEAEWLNKSFEEFSRNLTYEDFEKRKIELICLEPKYKEIAKKFCEHKLHNVSHLKEYGVIFVIPTDLELEGTLFRLLTLVFHYSFEIKFYSSIFEKYAKKEDFFKVINWCIKGEVLEEANQNSILVVQRYLYKDDEWDSRLFLPRVNTEAYHYSSSLKALADFSKEIGHNIDFWKDIDWVGDLFLDENGIEVLISFNLVDVIMNLVEQSRTMKKVVYHQQEAMWNKLFEKALGPKFSRIFEDFLVQGYVSYDDLKVLG